MARSTDIDEVPTPIGRAPAFLGMLDQVSRLAPLRRPVLVIGERGTGKELAAARLALLSDRWDRPLVKLNCAALPEALLDSELFGHEAGAFTGAQKRRLSRFERADGGTMFLDEIGTASQAVQEKLLRVIEYGSFERVGGSETIRVDVRLIGATNADLPAMAREGRFRADLLDRLAFDVVNIPPLRARPEDISLLAEHFATRMSAELGRKMFAGFTERALERLQAYDWPGNVRELRNVVERSVYRMDRPEKALDEIVLDPFVVPDWKDAQVQCAVTAVPAVVPAVGEALTFPRDFGADVRTHERSLLEAALREAQFSQRRAAELLGLTYYQFRHHLRLHGLADKEARKALGVKE
ncbi:phage shock protein operon transcriptional activator [Gluconobacter kondonii]|uniref:Phage shock protein operon transcriptional activator n=1 Tax=Gluconobacter kondonii TaxID=941463 RepID=A0ABQ5WT00_9PROT|nr:phage shock protein operon transcriptional activator [Gluconobacter kondonii]GBR31738.1 PSP operon transcriptional activator PspF [Gluconobacter kondonii NBRC 3266]GLQ66035.1 phage shock protein operon transcriptional activator [Gluconobacter kondonii]